MVLQQTLTLVERAQNLAPNNAEYQTEVSFFVFVTYINLTVNISTKDTHCKIGMCGGDQKS